MPNLVTLISMETIKNIRLYLNLAIEICIFVALVYTLTFEFVKS